VHILNHRNSSPMWNKIFIFIFLLLYFFVESNAQVKRQTISGFVRDSVSGEILIGANLYPDNMDWGTVTDEHGFFSVNLSTGTDSRINFSYVGYRTKRIQIDQLESESTVIYLSPDLTIPEIEIRRVQMRLQESGRINVNPKVVNRMPSFFGEKDILRSLQHRAGVQTGKEGSAGLVVRGGGPDQNLTLVDGVPLYYYHHLGNLLSAFDPDAINSATFIKGGFPAHMGGRLSSITDIRLKEGNKEQYKGVFSLGTLAMKASVEGPLNENTSFLFSLRRCNLDLMTRLLSYMDSDGKGMAGYTFYDANLKIRHRVSTNTILYLTLFSNRDRIFLKFWDDDKALDIQRDFKDDLAWSNNFGSLRLNHQYNAKNIADLSLSYSVFNYGHSIVNEVLMSGELNQNGLSTGTAIKDAFLKYDHTYYYSNNLRFRYGSNIALHRYAPYKFDSLNSEELKSFLVQEFVAYFESEYRLKAFTGNIGLRYTGIIGDSFFHIPEPRIRFAYDLTPDKVRLSTSFSKMHQPLHLVSDNTGGIPVDIWVPASTYLPPEISDQFDLGLMVNNIFSKGISFKLEGFLKRQQKLIELVPGNNIYTVLESPELSIVKNGEGTIRGIEMEVAKQKGSISGWASYMYIMNSRQFELINNGAAYPYNYEKPHNFNVVLMSAINDHTNLTLVWQFTSGMSYNLPVGKYEVPVIPGIENPIMGEAHIYGPKNSIRLKPYHRLDISLDFIKWFSKGKRIFNVSLINAYNRQNPFFLFYMENDQDELTLHQLCLFPILPSVSYRIEF